MANQASEKLHYIYQLRHLMDISFNMAEIKTLCLELDVDYDHLAGEQKSSKINELILHLGRRGRLNELHKAVAKERSHLDWPQIADVSQQIQDTAIYETGIIGNFRQIRYVAKTIWITGMFISLAGFALLIYVVINFISLIFGSFYSNNLVNINSISFQLLSVSFGLMFVGIVIITIGVATSILSGSRIFGKTTTPKS